MVDVFDVAEYILGKIGFVSTMKLQKLAFYSQALSLVENGEPLFPEHFQAWVNGPVCYELFSCHRGKYIVGPGDICKGSRNALDGRSTLLVDRVIRKNAIVTSFNRNFRRRADGNPNTFAFIGSPELTVALTIAGRLDFNPATDTLLDKDGNSVMLDAPTGFTFPPKGFAVEDKGFIAPSEENANVEVVISPDSNRLQKLAPFAPWDGKDLTDMPLLIKTEGKCTTDHISMAGPWLKFRGHLQNISDNLLMGAVNAFNGESNKVKNQLDGAYVEVSTAAKAYKAKGICSIVVAEDNYGEGSSREHAAMEPRFLNVKVILAKSFARIHETNLKKQGMLALTFCNKDDYNKVQEDDRISLTGLKEFAPGSKLTVTLKHKDGSEDNFEVEHTYNDTQIAWFKAGSALNFAAKK